MKILQYKYIVILVYYCMSQMFNLAPFKMSLAMQPAKKSASDVITDELKDWVNDPVNNVYYGTHKKVNIFGNNYLLKIGTLIGKMDGNKPEYLSCYVSTKGESKGFRSNTASSWLESPLPRIPPETVLRVEVLLGYLPDS